MNKILSLFGYEIKKPSLLLMHMLDTTHAGWIQRITWNGDIRKYQYHLYT